MPCLAIDLNNISLSKKKKIKSFYRDLFKLRFDKIQVKGPDLNSKIPIFCEFLLSETNSRLNPLTTRIIDLRQSEDDLKEQLGKAIIH